MKNYDLPPEKARMLQRNDLSTKQVAELLGVTIMTVYREVKRGQSGLSHYQRTAHPRSGFLFRGWSVRDYIVKKQGRTVPPV